MDTLLVGIGALLILHGTLMFFVYLWGEKGSVLDPISISWPTENNPVYSCVTVGFEFHDPEEARYCCVLDRNDEINRDEVTLQLSTSYFMLERHSFEDVNRIQINAGRKKVIWIEGYSKRNALSSRFTLGVVQAKYLYDFVRVQCYKMAINTDCQPPK